MCNTEGEGKILKKNVLWKVSFRTGKRFMDQRKEVVGVVKGYIFSVFCECCVTRGSYSLDLRRK